MISVDASELICDDDTIEFLKNSNLYQTMVETFGEEKAAHIIKDDK